MWGPIQREVSPGQIIHAKGSEGNNCPDEESYPRCGDRVSAVISVAEGIAVGTITVSNDHAALYIELKTTDKWYYDLSQIAVAGSLEEIPREDGILLYDLFPYFRSYDPYFAGDCYSIPLLWEAGTQLYFVFRSGVAYIEDGVLIRENIAWAEGEEFPGETEGTYVVYTIQACEESPPVDPPPENPPSDDPPSDDPPADLTGLFRTQTQGGWGTACNRDNPGCYLDANFEAAFPSGLTIGCETGNTAHFAGAASIREFLPEGGTPSPFLSDHEDPLWTEAGVLAGQVTALALNVGLDSYDPDFGVSELLLGDLVVADPDSPFLGWMVSEVLAEANVLLGGCSDLFTFAETNECVSRINQNLTDGESDNGFLRLPE